jgi:hypothetical protein
VFNWLNFSGSGLDKRRRRWVFWSTFLGGAREGGAGEGGAFGLMSISTLFAGSEAEEWTSELRRERKGDNYIEILTAVV